MTDFALTVVGGGLAGLCAALALAPVCENHGKKLALIAPKAPSADGRTTALLMPSIALLEDLGLWEDCKELAAPLRTMRMIDDTGRLFRAPLVDFNSAELDLEAFGYNVPNALLAKHLEDQIAQCGAIERFDALVEGAICHEDGVELTLSGGKTIRTDAVAAADGRNSTLRQIAGIETRDWSYPQTAIVLNFKHSLPHFDVSSEFHTQTGPFTQVPLPPLPEATNRSSLIWVVTPQQALILQEQSPEDLAPKIEEKMQSCLGRVEIEGAIQSFPLSGMMAKSFAANHIFLLGEAGHVFPPIGAQGFNLGLRDVMALRDCLQSVLSRGQNAGSLSAMEAYQRMRSTDVHLSTAAVDALNRSLLVSFLPVQAARSLGLMAVGQFSWLRRQIMKQGFGPASVDQRFGNKSTGNSPVAIR